MELMKLDDYKVNMKTAAILDYYTGAVWWAREEQFTPEQMSLFFTIIHSTLENVKGTWNIFILREINIYFTGHNLIHVMLQCVMYLDPKTWGGGNCPPAP